MSAAFIKIIPDLAFGRAAAPPAGIAFDHDPRPAPHGEGGIVIGMLDDLPGFSRPVQKHKQFRELIKHADSDYLVIPSRFAQFEEALAKIAGYEAIHASDTKERPAEFMIRQSLHATGERQAQIDGNWHQDRKLLTTELKTDRIYVVVDRDGMLFQERPLADAFNRLAGIDAPVPGLVKQLAPGEIALVTSNNFHSGPPALEDGLRNFIRVMYQSPPRQFAPFSFAGRAL